MRVPTLPSHLGRRREGFLECPGKHVPPAHLTHLNNLLSPPQQRLTELTQTNPATLLHPLSDLEHSLFFGEWPEMFSHPTRCVSGVEGGHRPSTGT